ncbi:hypothetical protein ACFYXF_35170 [Streptomyces sp. NPDC002680]|uniref:hypothetical protein n=1 Tax=Streptomyces sp. NPDC002680 TaxID=3364659 RepID=UPI0036765788
MSDAPGRPNWQLMTPQDFGVRAKTNQGALFLVDELDAEYPQRAVEADGTVHAARYVEDRNHFTTKCAEHSAPVIDRLEYSRDRKVTCRNCAQ